MVYAKNRDVSNLMLSCLVDKALSPGVEQDTQKVLVSFFADVILKSLVARETTKHIGQGLTQ